MNHLAIPCMNANMIDDAIEICIKENKIAGSDTI